MEQHPEETYTSEVDQDQHVLNLECILVAVAIKLGTGDALALTEDDIKAAVGRTFKLQLGLPDGGIRVTAGRPGQVAAAAAPQRPAPPEFVFAMPSGVH